MKAVIWVACVLVATGIQTAAKAGGVTLGAIPMALVYGGMVFIANVLSRKWDEKHPKGK